MAGIFGFTNYTATISAGTAVSDAVSVGNRVVVGLLIPATWTAAGITFQVSIGDDTWVDLWDKAAEFASVAAASRYIVLDPDIFVGICMLKIRSGTSAVPVNQAADRSVVIVTRNIV